MSVSASVVFDDGTGPALFVAGSFDSAGAVRAGNIAKWDGIQFSAVGPGFDGVVSALAVYDAGSGPALYAAGAFTHVGARAANRIARWDGSTWSALGAGTDGAIRSLAVYDPGTGPALFVAGEFDAAGGSLADDIATWDGASWAPVGSGLTGYIYQDPPVAGGAYAMTVFDDGTGPTLVVSGQFRTAGGVPALRIARWNGTSWSALGAGIAVYDSTVVCLAAFDPGTGPRLYAGGSDLQSAGTTYAAILRWDGSSWSTVASGLGSADAFGIHDVGTGAELYAAGYDYASSGEHLVKGNGTTWTPVAGVFDYWCRTLTSYDGGSGPELVVGGAFTRVDDVIASRLVRRRSGTWTALGSGNGVTDNRVVTIGEFGNGTSRAIYAGGHFSAAGTTNATCIARWSGSTWTALGSGIRGTPTTWWETGVAALREFDSGTGPLLYAGGQFSLAGDVPAANIARWSGTAWSSVNGGLTGPATGTPSVATLEVLDDGSGPALYVGGLFAYAGGVPATGIARWNGTSWSSVGGGLAGAWYGAYVADITAFDDGTGTALYAAGWFDKAGGASANCIARWDGSSWSACGTGLTGAGLNTAAAFALAVHDDGSGPALYVAGYFTHAGGLAVANIARWNGSVWSPVGAGLGVGQLNYVSTLAVHDDGLSRRLVAGGRFSVSGPTRLLNLAQWDGVSWSPLAGGCHGGVLALASFDDRTGNGADLYVGGWFSSAGSTPSVGFAELSGCGPPGAEFCSGDGSAALCPCGNFGAPGNGCANSIAANGAHLGARGTPNVGADSLVLVARAMPNTLAVFLQGSERDASGAGTPLLDGLRCVSGTIVRLGTSGIVSGMSTYPGTNSPPISLRGSIPTAGTLRFYQVLYRNPDPSFCPPASANASNGLAITWLP